MNIKPFSLPHDFLLGSATASLQIEGGDRNNSWYRWCEQGHIKDGSHCIVADDHWNRIDEDIHLMKKMNHQVYRMSLEWSRIEPKMGVFNDEAMEHYRDEIKKLKKAGIEPLVTLHHFSNPLWMEDREGWANPESVKWFENYTAHVVEELGEIVDDWITINEPNVYLAFGYVYGNWPPGEKSIGKYFKSARNMIHAHLKAYHKIHSIRKLMNLGKPRVGTAFHLRIYDPKRETGPNRFACRMLEWLFQDIFIAGMIDGKLMFPVGTGQYPEGKGVYSDFFGINYYTRDIVSFSLNPAQAFAKMEVKENAPINDLGWEIYPEGISRISKEMYLRYRLPIFITENGTCDSKDVIRSKYIYDHLYQISQAIDEGIPIQRYYHWSTMDNFEWIEGLSARFGLVHVNYENQKRTINRSGRFYAEVCKAKEVTPKMISKYFHKI